MSATRRKFITLGSVLTVTTLETIRSQCEGDESKEPAQKDERSPDMKKREAMWADLEKPEPDGARALLSLADDPKGSVLFLRENLKPLKLEVEQLHLYLATLGSNKKNVWEPAFEALEYFDPRLAIDLQTLMKDVTDTPVRQRLVEILSEREPGSLEGKTIELSPVNGGEYYNFRADNSSWWAEHKVSKLSSGNWNFKKKWTRAVRAIVLLEHIATPEARAILKEMAAGHPEAHPTRAAQEAIKRLESKNG